MKSIASSGTSRARSKVTNDLFFQHVHPDDRQRVEDAVARAITERQPYEIEHRIIRPDGTERIVLEHAEIELDEQGRPLRMVGAVQDITERRRAEEALRGSEQRFRAVLENSLDVAYRRDLRNGRYDYISPVVEKITGLFGPGDERASARAGVRPGSSGGCGASAQGVGGGHGPRRRRSGVSVPVQRRAVPLAGGLSGRGEG